jgi:hypothetical protein|tara:strand:+ start:201 stop:383 length:183 start_codon:yes stop_codon:yes gene_type:complete
LWSTEFSIYAETSRNWILKEYKYFIPDLIGNYFFYATPEWKKNLDKGQILHKNVPPTRAT